MLKTSRHTTKARVTCSGVAPVSSDARKANVMPPRLTIELTTALVMISRRRGWLANLSWYFSRMGLGKYLVSVAWNQGSSGNALDSRSFLSASLASVSYTHLRAHETDSYLVCR